MICDTTTDPHRSNAIESRLFTTTTDKRVVLAENGRFRSSKIRNKGFGGKRSIMKLIASNRNMANISHPMPRSQSSRLKAVEWQDAPFVHIDFRKGGPILKTAATRIY
jgi:hypothetical protein